MANEDEGAEALEQLAEIRRTRQGLDERELEAVRVARRAGRSWAEIALMLGITRQSAWERWNELDPRPADPVDVLVSAARRARRNATIKVPELIGTTFAQASERLRRLGLQSLPVEVEPSQPDALAGLLVRAQAPEAGARLEAGSPVRLWLRHNGEGGDGVREPRRPTPRSGGGQAMRPVEEAG